MSKATILRTVELQNLAKLCGINKSGTRAELIKRLSDELKSHKRLPPNARVLSIDLGIRNLAFALLTPSQRQKGTVQVRDAVVHDWQRVALIPTDKKNIVPPGQEPGEQIAVLKKQDFSPGALSKLAVQLVEDRLLPLKPTHVLLERQRFRSAGGSNVLEWTVRVNMVESMLYAVFATLASVGRFGGVVLPVEPRLVGPFLLEREQEEAGSDEKTEELVTGRRGGSAAKQLKIDLLGRWLMSGEKVHCDGGQPKITRRAFLRRWLPNGKESTEPKEEAPIENEKKLDDVTDCLLQGVAWMNWDKNKKRVHEEYGDLLRDELEKIRKAEAAKLQNKKDQAPGIEEKAKLPALKRGRRKASKNGEEDQGPTALRKSKHVKLRGKKTL